MDEQASPVTDIIIGKDARRRISSVQHDHQYCYSLHKQTDLDGQRRMCSQVAGKLAKNGQRRSILTDWRATMKAKVIGCGGQPLHGQRGNQSRASGISSAETPSKNRFRLECLLADDIGDRTGHNRSPNAYRATCECVHQVAGM